MSGRISVRESGDVALVELCNETKLNALSFAMWQELGYAIAALSQSATLRCIRIKGAGEQAFSAGADISEFSETRSTFEQVVAFHEKGVGACLDAFLGCPIPIVAEIRGACMGGGLEIACACDLRLADETARFGAPVGRLGFPLAFGETQGLFALVGPSVAAELLLEGRILSASDALQRRLITRLSSAGSLAGDVDAAVADICKSGRWAARSHKHQLRRLARDPSPVTREERMAVYGFATTDEYRDGIRRFLGRKHA
jgi:enoyl-CoA hydratase/carnithine racemase